MEITYLKSDSEFESLKNASTILVVDFFSDDCPPCEKLVPIYEKMALKFPTVKFIKIFRQEHRDLASSLGVSGSPTVLFFKSGELSSERLSGDISEKELSAMLISLGAEISSELSSTEQKTEIVDLCIIGNGPAGLTAAVYAARYKIKQVLVGDLPGGLMTASHKICNYPSEIEISGMALSQKMQDQVNSQAVPQIAARVESIEQANGLYNISLTNKDIIRAKTILLATGTKHRHLGIANEKALTGRGVSYCATCDAMFFKNKTVAVIGGSDSANTAALHLAQFAEKVYQIYRGSALRGETAWIEQVKANPKINIIYNTNVTELLGTDSVSGLKLDQTFAGSNQLSLDGVFVEIGSEPELSIINQLSLETDKSHYIVTQESQATNREGVWAAGDITTGSNSFRQIITACSEGAIAAESIFKYLQINK
ncbi:MAG: FAD-dependent oxidoreductase [Patescibacteria group bacterium]